MSLTVEIGTDSSGHTTFGVPNSVARLRFFFGQLLTQRDLQGEQRFHLVLQRLMQREAFGTGTVAGLAVGTRAGLPVTSVVVSPGLAMDPGGRELLLEKEVVIDVAEPPLQRGAPFSEQFGSEPATLGELASDATGRFMFPAGSFTTTELSLLGEKLVSLGVIVANDLATLTPLLENIPRRTTAPVLPPPVTDPDLGELPGTVVWILGQLLGETFLGLRFRELGIDPAPALRDPSCCNGTVCTPARTQEGVFIVAGETPFEVDDPFETFKQCLSDDFTSGDCHPALCACLTATWRGLPTIDDPCTAEDLPVVPLARVLWNRFEQATDRILAVDNCSWVPLTGSERLRRPLAPGGPMLRALVEVITGCTVVT
jgi:hypothetical protein